MWNAKGTRHSAVRRILSGNVLTKCRKMSPRKTRQKLLARAEKLHATYTGASLHARPFRLSLKKQGCCMTLSCLGSGWRRERRPSIAGGPRLPYFQNAQVSLKILSLEVGNYSFSSSAIAKCDEKIRLRGQFSSLEIDP